MIPQYSHTFPLVPGMKLPAIKEWQKTRANEYPAVGNYGIALQPTDLVLDFDVWKAGGRESLERFLKRYPNFYTRIIKTPRGGFHIYTTKPANIRIKKQQTDWPGVDFLSDGHYVVGPGTTTIATKDSAAGTYTLFNPSPTAEVPADLLASLESPADPLTQTTGEPTLLLESTFKTLCANKEPATRGSRGIESYKLACQGRDYGLPLDVTYEHMRDQWLPRWTEQFSESELLTQCQHAYEYAKNALGSKNPESRLESFAPLEAPPPAKENVVSMDTFQAQKAKEGTQPETLLLQKNGAPKDCLANVAYLLKHDAAWRGQFRYNQFASSLEFISRPPWRADQLNQGLSLTKRDLSNIQVWFSNTQGLEIPENKIIAALETIAQPVHPVKHYLESVVWDGIPRLDRLFIDTLGAEDSPFIRDAARVLGLSSVRRIYEPGCKQDYVWVYEGAQGLKKSIWIETWGGEWSSTGQLVRGDKDTYQNLRGKWIVELPEINATFSKQDDAWVKGIVSTRIDTYRASYERTSHSVPRESLFIATINPNASKEYLRDDENRRWLPIMCRQVDIDKLIELRDQYFAEAVHRYKLGEKAYITDEKVIKLAKLEQEKRREKDPWTEILAPWANSKADGFSPAELYQALGLNAGSVGGRQRARLYAVMRELGYIHYPVLGTGGIWRKEIDWSKV